MSSHQSDLSFTLVMWGFAGWGHLIPQYQCRGGGGYQRGVDDVSSLKVHDYNLVLKYSGGEERRGVDGQEARGEIQTKRYFEGI